jgi:hypothetical protein
MVASVSRLGWQPRPTAPHGPSRRSCHPSHPRIRGANVLEEEETTVGFQDAGNLGKRCRRLGNGAENERCHGRVEARIRKGQMLSAGFDYLRGTPNAWKLLLELVAHPAVGLGQDKLGDGIRIELDVDPGTGADFQGPSARPYQQCAAPSA